MSPSTPKSISIQKLSVRLPESQRRRFKSLAAGLGMSLQEAVHQALEAWMSQHDPQGAPPRDPHSGGRQGADVGKPKRKDRATTSARDRRKPGVATVGAGGVSSQARGSGAMRAQPPDPAAAGWAWLRRAPQLDWSQCPVVELLGDKTGSFWVFRGTDIPLAGVLLRLINGHGMAEILARNEGLTQEQVKAVLQYAAKELAFSAAAR